MNKKNLEALIKGLNKLLDDLEDNKAPRTGFKKPTEEEKREFDGLLTAINILKKAKPLEPVKYFDLGYSEELPQSFFHCPIHKKTKLTRFKSKKGNGQVCTKCNPKLIK